MYHPPFFNSSNFSINMFIRLVFLLFLICVPALVSSEEVKICNLLVEYERQPMGIYTQKPRFSWQMHAREGMRNCYQKAYQIVVKDCQGQVCWDSGKVGDDRSLNIVYDGRDLKAESRYNWTLYVWDQNDVLHQAQSWFETGLYAKDDKDKAWRGAQWIGVADEDQVLYAHYLPVFRLGYTITLDHRSHSTKASVCYGGNDGRLLDKNMNSMHLQAVRDSVFIRIELDGSQVDRGMRASVNIYRKGYHPDNCREKVMARFDIPESIVHTGNLYQPHRIEVLSNLGDTKVKVDGKETGSVNLNPLGRGGDFIAYPILGDIGVSLEPGQSASFSELAIANYRSPGNTIAAIHELSGKFTGGKHGYQTLTDPSRHGMPMLRAPLHLEKDVSSARLYVTSRGVYDFYVNGKRVGDDYLNPGITQYNKTQMYQTFDVTGQLRKGENMVGAILGEGWWSGGATYEGQNWNYFGDRLSMLAKLCVRFADGSEKILVSNPEEWEYSVEGPLRYGSLFQGEVYDARKEIADWCMPGYAGNHWKRAVVISTDGHVSSEGWGNGPAPDDYSQFTLIPQYGQTIQERKRLMAKSVKEERPGVFIYDMGQNMVGVPAIHFTGLTPGTRVKVRYAEVLYPDLPAYEHEKGMLMLENIRAAMAQDIYIAKGGSETFSPRFTSHGYRYLEITGIGHALPLACVEGVVLSSIDKLDSYYSTSNPLVNKLWENMTWSTLANFMSIPTDCPQRNERLGWAGDISVYSPTATYMARLPQFLRRYLQAMRDVQRADGRMPDIAPLGGGFGNMLWGSASITIPWECYQQYGDRVVLAEHYDAAKRYMAYIFSRMIDKQTNIIVQDRSWGDLGDWLGLEDKKNDKSLFWEAYLIYELKLMEQIASVLGKKEDARWYGLKCQERKDFFVSTYIRLTDYRTVSSGFDGEKGRLIDTQTSYVLPLALGVVEGDMAVRMADNLRKAIEREGVMDNGEKCPPYSLLTGFIGTAWINKALSDMGLSEVAYRLLQQKEYPSWLYPVTQGATTIWERLNSYTHQDGFGGNNRMNSFNHYSFGAVGAWMYNYSLGIRRDEQSPGFKHFILQPVPDPTGEMKCAHGYYDSMYGRIESGWSVNGDEIIFDFCIPANTSATWKLPDGTTRELPSGRYHFLLKPQDFGRQILL